MKIAVVRGNWFITEKECMTEIESWTKENIMKAIDDHFNFDINWDEEICWLDGTPTVRDAIEFNESFMNIVVGDENNAKDIGMLHVFPMIDATKIIE